MLNVKIYFIFWYTLIFTWKTFNVTLTMLIGKNWRKYTKDNKTKNNKFCYFDLEKWLETLISFTPMTHHPCTKINCWCEYNINIPQIKYILSEYQQNKKIFDYK